MADEPSAAPATGAGAEAKRVLSEAEAEIKHLVQELHNKIIALGGEHWVTDLSLELREARNAVESAGEWVMEHFSKGAK